SETVLQGNYIGTDVTGTHGLGNGVGVDIWGASQNTIGGSAPGAANRISGNRGDGLRIRADFSPPSVGNSILGNLIGTDAGGVGQLGNGGHGVFVTAGARDNTIGGGSEG